jgi:hypothetical protein
VGRAAVFVFVAALVVFCVVQDRITARGVHDYVTAQRAALAGERPLLTIEQVMQPAVQRSVEQGALWATATVAAGFPIAMLVERLLNRRTGRARGRE